MEEAHHLLHLLAQGRLGIGQEQPFGPLSPWLRVRRQKARGVFGNHGWTKSCSTGMLLPQEYADNIAKPIVAHLTVRHTNHDVKSPMPQTDEDLFLQNLIDRFRSTLGCEAASLYVADETGTRLDLRAATGYQKPLLVQGGVHYKFGEGLTGWIAQEGKVLHARSLLELQKHPHHGGKMDKLQWESPGARSFLGIPLRHPSGKVLGVIKAEDKTGDDPSFTPRDIAIAESFAELATMAIALRREKENLSKFLYAFVLMPFDAQFNDIYQYGIKKPITELGITCERVDEIQYVGGILDQVFRSIEKARFVIADMTGRNPNVFYEVGYCHALKKDVILCTQSADDIPFDLRGYNHIIYEGKIGVLEKALRERVPGLLSQIPEKDGHK
jgi:hypothetical protein